MAFTRGDEVEVASKKKGSVGSYFAAKVIDRDGKNYIVQYKNAAKEIGVVTADELRPVPSDVRAQCVFRVGDNVDAFYSNGWWRGTICEVCEDNYVVYIDAWKQRFTYPACMLRSADYLQIVIQ